MWKVSEGTAVRLAAGALFLVSIYLFLLYVVPLLFYPSEGLYLSGFFHKCGTLWFEGGIPYLDFACPQPPLATLLAGAGQLIWKSVATTRILGLLAFLGIVYVSKRVIELETGRKVPIEFLFLFFVAPFLYKTSINTIFIDVLCALLALVGVYFYRKGEKGGEGKSWLLEKNPNTVLAGVLLFLSTMAKYFGPAFVAGIILYGIFKRKWKQTGIFAATYFLLLAASAAVLQWVTEGYFLSDTLFHLFKPFQPGGGGFLTYYLMIDLFPILYLGVYYLMRGNWKAVLEGPASFYGMLFAAVAGEAFYFIYKSGGALNYALYVELLVLLLLYIESLSMGLKGRTFKMFLAAVLLVQFLVYANASYTDTTAFLKDSPSNLKANSYLEETARLTDKPVISEFSSITFWNARFPEKGRFSDAYMFHDLKRLGLWDDQELINEVKENDVQLIIIANRFELFDKFLNYTRREFNETTMCYFSPDYDGIAVSVFTNNATLWKEVKRLRDEQYPYCKAARPEYNTTS